MTDDSDPPADRLHRIKQDLVLDIFGFVSDFNIQLHGCRDILWPDLPLIFLNSLAAVSIRGAPAFGPFHPRNLSSLDSSSSVATKNFSISLRTCLGRSRASLSACSRWESRGTAISRSFRMGFLPFSVCRTSSTPMILHFRTRPGAVAVSCITRASIGSPSSPLVDGM